MRNTPKNKYTVCVVTGTRAEYGLLSPVLRKIQASEKLELNLVVTGAHLSTLFGSTVKEIEADGFQPAAQIDILKFKNTPRGVAETVGYATMAFAKYFSENRPHCVLVLGDRYEIYAVATAASILNIPLAHISGGDVTQGAQDEFFRHSISKMAKLHFPSCDSSARRLQRMGEEPGRVFNVGALGDENIRNFETLTREELAASLHIELKEPFALITYHPQTAPGSAPPEKQVEELLAALDAFPNMGLLFTKANADAGGMVINAMLDTYCEKRANASAHVSLGLRRYLSAMQHCALVLGNSSSGVVEAPSFHRPVVNIGMRQAGREVCENVINCGINRAEIEAAIATACTPAFIQKAKRARSPYNGGNTSGKIVTTLERWLESGALAGSKKFYEGKETV
ncbi:UDP-N-acetylglucosamine 2-epimerase [Ruminococcaceae bacterium OttesenSCG-928-N02]|nr:UDP-N-acetylglucosamine 2-epimerase [Ruminococcaceae bacterium OttesenSCG-928-N02]